MEGPLEATLIGCHVTGSRTEEKEDYARLFNASTTYTHKQSPKEVLHVEEQASDEKEMSTLKVELEPLPSHLRYEFLGSNHQFPVIVSAKLDGP